MKFLLVWRFNAVEEVFGGDLLDRILVTPSFVLLGVFFRA
jgi:hypothetical protein